MTDHKSTSPPNGRGQSRCPPGSFSYRISDPPPPLSLHNTAVFLDFDGTLVSIADHPDRVSIAPSLVPLLIDLSSALKGRLAIVTGRSIAALEALIGPIPVAIAGSHGGEFRPSATDAITPLSDPLPTDVVVSLNTFAQSNGGLLVEPKPFSVAVHYRHHPDAAAALLTCAQDLAAHYGLHLTHGKKVIELAMPGSDKGTAVSQFMNLPAFTGAQPIFLGDDVTDEDAFRAVKPMGGYGILIGPTRATTASFCLPTVASVHDWLKAPLPLTMNRDRP